MAETSRKPVYAVMTFDRAKGGYSFNPPIPVKGEQSAVAMAHRMSERHVGAVAFYRVGDPEFGEYDEPVILERVGEQPFDLRELFAG